jgi:hypothetical protein
VGDGMTTTKDFEAARRKRAWDLMQQFQIKIPNAEASTDEQLERAVIMELLVIVLRHQVRASISPREPDQIVASTAIKLAASANGQ